MTLDVLTIETRLVDRWKRQGHDPRYVEVTENGSTWGCSKCGHEVSMTMTRLGGWWISGRDLDKECTG